MRVLVLQANLAVFTLGKNYCRIDLDKNFVQTKIKIKMKISKTLIIALAFVIFTMLSVGAKVNLSALKAQVLSNSVEQTDNLQAVIVVRR